MTNLPPAKVNASPPAFSDGQGVSPSLDINGNLRVVISGTGTGSTNVTIVPGVQGSASSKTGTLLTVTNASPVAIITSGPCSFVTIQEDNSVSNWPTVAFQIMAPLSSSPANQYAAGSSYTFRAPFGSRWGTGVTVGYIQLPSAGSSSFLVDFNG